MKNVRDREEKQLKKLYKIYGIKKRYCGFLDFGDLDSQIDFYSYKSLKEWKEACSFSNDGSQWVGDGDNCKEIFQKPLRKYPPFTEKKIVKLLEYLILRYNISIYKGGNGEEIEINSFCGALFLAGKTLKEVLVEFLIELRDCLTSEEEVEAIKGILDSEILE